MPFVNLQPLSETFYQWKEKWFNNLTPLQQRVGAIALGAIVMLATFLVLIQAFKKLKNHKFFKNETERQTRASFKPTLVYEAPTLSQSSAKPKEPYPSIKPPVFDSKVISGNLENGLLEGQGKIQYANGNIHEGNFIKGKLNGKGKITVKSTSYLYSEDVYEGIFKDDRLYGQGSKKVQDSLFSGEFFANKLNGKGTLRYNTGGVDEGLFIDDHLIEGKMTLRNGDVYEGSFEDKFLTGWGKATFVSGEVWEGIFKRDFLEGIGTKKVNGNVYEGTFSKSKLQGKGSITYRDGIVIKGEFVDDQPHGICTQTFTDGSSITRTFNKGS